MGIYWYAVNHTEKEYIEPPDGFDYKHPGIVSPGNPFASMLVNAMVFDWKHGDIEIINDMGAEYEWMCEDYTNVTDKQYEQLNQQFSEGWDPD